MIKKVEKEELGQVFITGIAGLSLLEEEAEFISNAGIGGVILFARNYSSPEQLIALVNQLHSLPLHRPLLISVDQEGGRVVRFKKDFTQFPPMLDIGGKNSPTYTYDVHSTLARELKVFGITINFSPVCDIFSNPENKVIGDRAFGKTANDVSSQITAAIRGMQKQGVVACAKHFPGHGDTVLDSHFDLPIIEASVEMLRERELIPFHRAVKTKVEMIMMAHLLLPVIDDQLPCSLSAKAYEWLRKELHFTRLIVTDDMEMEAITKRWGVEEAAILSFVAGADLLIYRNLNTTKKAYDAVLKEFGVNATIKALLPQKIERQLKLREKYPIDPVHSLANFAKTVSAT